MLMNENCIVNENALYGTKLTVSDIKRPNE